HRQPLRQADRHGAPGLVGGFRRGCREDHGRNDPPVAQLPIRSAGDPVDRTDPAGVRLSSRLAERRRLMLEGLYSAAAGMSAQQEKLDAVSNDLANISTTRYQSERVAFSDLLYNAVDEAGTESSIGAGSSAQVIGRSHAQGPIQETGDPLDLA